VIKGAKPLKEGPTVQRKISPDKNPEKNPSETKKKGGKDLEGHRVLTARSWRTREKGWKKALRWKKTPRKKKERRERRGGNEERQKGGSQKSREENARSAGKGMKEPIGAIGEGPLEKKKRGDPGRGEGNWQRFATIGQSRECPSLPKEIPSLDREGKFFGEGILQSGRPEKRS